MTSRAKITVAQYEAFLAQPENVDRRFELIAGEIAEKVPTQLHAYIIQMLSGFLFVFLRQNPIGYALIEAPYRLPNDEENDLIPNLSFVTKGLVPRTRSAPTPYFPNPAREPTAEGQ